jgi:hypothetical protein
VWSDLQRSARIFPSLPRSSAEQARRNAPSVLFWPHACKWWEQAPESLKSTLSLLADDAQRLEPLLIVATLDHDFEAPLVLLRDSHTVVQELPAGHFLRAFFDPRLSVHQQLATPSATSLSAYFASGLSPAPAHTY